MQAALPGPVLVMYPLIPRSVYKTKRTMIASAAAPGANLMAAAGAQEEHGSDDSSGSEDDCSGKEGQLPEVLTKASTTMSKWERESALARDRFEIDALLGQHDLTQVCPKAITFSYKQDNFGARSSDKGLLLTRAPASGGTATASGGTKSNDPFEKSATFRDGVLVELEHPREFINASRKLSIECRRSQAVGWKTEGLTIASRNHAAGKVARGQIGRQTYEALLTDLVQNCTAPNLLVNDFMAGVGEVGVAAVRVKVSEAAKQCGVRVFYWGCDERRIFGEVARASIRTCIGEAFLARELVVPGLEPVQAPSPTTGPGPGISKAGVEKVLLTPMGQLSLAADGTLVIPTEKELTDNPPVSLTPELLSYFDKLREEFPQSKPQDSQAPAAGGTARAEITTAVGGSPAAPALDKAGQAAIGGAAFLEGGYIVGNRAELLGFLRQSGPKSKILKEVPQNGEWGFLLVEVEDKEAPYRVLMENRSKAQIKLTAGTFVGRGGPGSLVSVPPEGRQLLHAWLYTRCHEWKRDVATRGNGFWVMKKAPASGGKRPPSGGNGAASGAGTVTPRLQTLEELQSELGAAAFDNVWAHSVTRGARAVRVSPVDTPVWWVPKAVMPEDEVAAFDASQLGAWVPSREQQTATGLECAGLLRPAFEVQLDGPNKKTLTPDANPATGGNPLCLFLKKNLILKPEQLVVL
jgi:hypothetical protein